MNKSYPAMHGNGSPLPRFGAAYRQTLKQDYRHQRYPISELTRDLELYRIGRRQLFELTVSYERNEKVIEFGHVSTLAIKCSNGYEQRSIGVYIREYSADEDVWVHVIYNMAYFQQPEVEALQHRFDDILNYVIDHPAAAIKDIPLVPHGERRLVIETWNATEVAYPQDKTLHRLFEEQVERTPKAVAVEYEEQSLNYSGTQCTRQSSCTSLDWLGRASGQPSRDLCRAQLGHGGWPAGHS